MASTNKETLLSKYQIPVQHLDFDYVEKCDDSKELEKILQILNSGEEGYYPDLSVATEKRLAILKPKSKLLRKICPVIYKESLEQHEQAELKNDLKTWVNDVNKNNDKLNSVKVGTQFPKIRKSKQYQEQKINNSNKNKSKRISSTDYQSWDKYDADTELLKMDLQEEKIKNSKNTTITNNNNNNSSNSNINNSSSKKTTERTIEMPKIEPEATIYATKEKDKGNEYFKAGDYKEAIHHYTNSLNCKLTIPSLTNRALTYLKMKKFSKALDDCQQTLEMDPNNIKAILRKAQALEGLGQVQQALKEAERAIKIDPNHTLAQELASTFQKQCGIAMKKTRLAISDATTTTTTAHPNNDVIPIPGPSRNRTGPHFIVCKDDPETVKQEVIKSKPQQIVHIVSVDNTNSDNEDDCQTIHLCKKAKKRDTNYDQQACGDKIGEIIFNVPDDLHSPYSFLKTWNSADNSLNNYSIILKNMDASRFNEVIGCKLDNTMFSTILKCLSMNFTVPGDVNTIYSILQNIVNVPRFDIIALLKSDEDRRMVNVLVDFLKQHGKNLPNYVIVKLLN